MAKRTIGPIPNEDVELEMEQVSDEGTGLDDVELLRAIAAHDPTIDAATAAVKLKSKRRRIEPQDVRDQIGGIAANLERSGRDD